MHQLQNGMDSILSRTDLGEDEKAKEFLQLQNRYLTFKQQLNTNTLLPNGIRPEEMNTSPPEVNLSTSTGDSTTVTALSTPLNAFNVTPNLNQASTGDSTTVTALSTPLNAFNLTPNLKQAAILQTPKVINRHPTTLKSCHTNPSSHSRNTITNAYSTKARKAADSVCKLLRWRWIDQETEISPP